MILYNAEFFHPHCPRLPALQEPGSTPQGTPGTEIHTQNATGSPPITDDWFPVELDSWSLDAGIPVFANTAALAQVEFEECNPRRNDPLVPLYQNKLGEQPICPYLSAEPLSIPTVPSLSGSSVIETPEGTPTPLPCLNRAFAHSKIDSDLLAVKGSPRHRASRSPRRPDEFDDGTRPVFSSPDEVHSVQATLCRDLESQQWAPAPRMAGFVNTGQGRTTSLLQSQEGFGPRHMPQVVFSGTKSPEEESTLASTSRRSTGCESQKRDMGEVLKKTTEKKRKLNAKANGSPGDDSSSDESGDATDKKPSPPSGKETRRFACPFLRRNPFAHRNCLNIKIKRIRDLKQHLRRTHYPPKFYCPVCFEEFPLRHPWERHIQSRQCQPPAQKPRKNGNVVSKEAQDILSQRADRKQSDIEQYNAIWDGLFGKDTSRPHNPYLGDMVEETMNLVSGFWRKKASEIIPPLLESRPGYAGKAKEVENLMLDLFEQVTAQFGQIFGEEENGDSDSTLKQPQAEGSSLVSAASKQSSPSESDLHRPLDISTSISRGAWPAHGSNDQTSGFEWPDSNYWDDTRDWGHPADEDVRHGGNGSRIVQGIEGTPWSYPTEVVIEDEIAD